MREERAFTDRFIERPVLAAVLSLGLVLLGLYAWRELGVRETPAVETPVVSVNTTWFGADPSIMESEVTEVLERQLNGIDGVRSLTSISRDQSSAITVEFELGRDLDDAANDVRSKVSRARKDLPDGVEEPVVEKSEADAQPVLYIQLAGEGRSLLELSELADVAVRDRLQTISGVSSVSIMGEQRYALRVELDPAALASRGITLADIENTLRNNNIDAPAGRLEGEQTELAIHLAAGLATPEEFAALVVTNRTGGPVRLGDLGRIRVGSENERTAGRSDGRPSVSVSVTPQANANILDIADQVYRRLPDIQRDLPAGTSLVVNYDRTQAVRTSIEEVEETLFLAFGLVVLVIFAFLRDVRSTLIPAVAAPVSLIGTFLFLWMVGFTINVFTLFGLVLAIGLVVDDAIVVLENVVRRIELGEDPVTAARRGTREIAWAVIATTVALIAVFLPVIFTGGATGRLFLEFGATVAVSVAISALVALTLTPALCARVLTPRPARSEAGPGRGFDALLRFVFRFPLLVVPVLGLALAVGAVGNQFVPREFFPLEDRNLFTLRVLAPEGTGFRWMNARMGELEPDLVAAVPERRMLMTRVATGGGGSAGSPNSGMYMIPLVPKADRERSQQEIVAALKPVLSGVTAFNVVPTQSPTVGRGFSSPLQFVILHPDFEVLAATLPKFLQAVRQIPGLTAVNEDLRLNRPELRARVDREKVAALGIPIRDVARTLQVLTSELEVSQFKRGSRSHAVMVGLRRLDRDTPAELGRVGVRAASGDLVPLANVLRFDEGSAASARYHFDRLPSATVSANLEGIAIGRAIDLVRAVAADTLPAGFRTALAGESKDFADSRAGLGAVFGLALALVYLTLAAQFNSFIDPIAILLSVPLALAGAMGGLVLFGMSLSFFSQVGLILLIGLVSKNGILIVEVAHQLRDARGLDRWEAAFEATRLRFRPILMTSVATIGGALPIALGFSAESRAPLGVTVVAGMVVATALSLFVTPVVYAALGSLVDRRAGGVAVATALAVSASADAAPLSLGDALSAAQAGNLDRSQQEARAEVAALGVALTRAAVLPTVTGSATVLYGNDSRFALDGGLGWGSTATAQLSVPLLDPAGWTGVRAAGLRADAARAESLAGLQAVLAEVAGRYVAVQQAEASVASSEALVARSERLVALAASRVDLGAAAPIELTRAEVARALDAQRSLAAKRERDDTRIQLAEILGAPLDVPLELEPARPLRLGTGDAADRPDLAVARLEAEATTQERRGSARAWSPTIDAVATAGALWAPPFDNPRDTQTVGLVASAVFFAGGARLADRRVSLALERSAASGWRDAEREAAVEVALSDRGVAVAHDGLALASQTARLAEKEAELAEDRFASGAANNVEVVDAQARLASAVQGEIDGLAAWNLAVVEWYRARGRMEELAGNESE